MLHAVLTQTEREMVETTDGGRSATKLAARITHRSSHLSGSGWPNRLEALTTQITHLRVAANEHRRVASRWPFVTGSAELVLWRRVLHGVVERRRPYGFGGGKAVWMTGDVRVGSSPQERGSEPQCCGSSDLSAKPCNH